MKTENRIQRWLFPAAVAGAMAVGAAGGTILNAVSVGAQTATPTPTAVSSPSPNNQDTDKETMDDAGGKFTPNEDSAHEANESPQREAQEDAGQHPTIK